MNTVSPRTQVGGEASGQEDCLQTVREQNSVMQVFVLYHRRSSMPEEQWDQLGTYENLDTARSAASEHGNGSGLSTEAWIMDRPDAHEWRLVVRGDVYKVECVLPPE
jgi:hypothetical protein